MSVKNSNLIRSRKVKEDGNVVNEANYLSPEDNGGEVLTVSTAGVIPLTVPTGSIQATITNPVPIRIAFGGRGVSNCWYIFSGILMPDFNF